MQRLFKYSQFKITALLLLMSRTFWHIERYVSLPVRLTNTVTLDRIQEKRLQWFGHVERMKTDRLPVKALHTKIEGKRSRGRQRKRLIDNVTADIKERGSCMQMPKELVHNREEWRSLTIQPPSSAASG